MRVLSRNGLKTGIRKTAETLVGKPAQAEGWFVRGATHHIELQALNSAERKISSYVKTIPLAYGMLLSLIALAWISISLL